MQEIVYVNGKRVVLDGKAAEPFVSQTRGAKILRLAEQGQRAQGIAPNGMRIVVRGSK